MDLKRFTAILVAAASLSACGGTNLRTASVGSIAPAEIAPVQMAGGREMAAPRGFVAMCKADAALCETPTTQAAANLPAEAEVALLRTVNRRVNTRVRQASDRSTSGVAELWKKPGLDRGAVGDCEDLAIEKRALLLAAGFPADRLFYAVAYQRQLGLHAVLVARVAQGDVVLDSRTPYLTSWTEAPYTWVSRQSTANPMIWHQVASASVTSAYSGATGATRRQIRQY
jgi:predicted transglutaminase-like cysteine proteinase